jgi:hypothetical protein
LRFGKCSDCNATHFLTSFDRAKICQHEGFSVRVEWHQFKVLHTNYSAAAPLQQQADPLR